LARRIVDNRDRTNRFLWDIRRTIGDLMAERFFGRFAELAHARGVGIDCETGYGTYPHPHIDGLQCAGKCDLTMGEFWHGTDIMSQFDGFCNVMRSVSSAAHIYGKKVVQAEAFTAWTHFQESPANLKPVGDQAFCDGLTRMVVHQYTHQPLIGPKPGIQYGAGTHLDRNLTWWPQAGPFLTYLARCQHLLEAGRFHADLCYFYGEGATSFVPGREHVRPALPAGYDCDFLNAEVLLHQTSVRSGRLQLASGMTYRLLVLPEKAALSVAALQKIRELLEAGATVAGSRPGRPPGLGGFPGGDEAASKLADSLWGTATPAGERTVGRGHLVWGKPLGEVLKSLGVPADFDVRRKDARIRFIHRTLPDAEVYFLSNQNARREEVECAFRIAGRQPELWNPVSGETSSLPQWRREKGQTLVPLRLEAHQSCFVVFRKGAAGAGDGKNYRDSRSVAELEGPWSVSFDPRWGGPETATFETLEDWTRRPEEGIRFYSGKATYHKSFDLPAEALGKAVLLDLGKLNHVAQVRLNGQDLGVVWCAPWRVSLGKAAKPRGNRLEIDVVNLWPNRMTGDSRLPPEKRYTRTNLTTYKPDSPLIPSGLLGPVRLEVEG
ncbi:MAG: glycosyl hydrolase, partial [Acidobacteria bacterium]|nr:glycosyl hydrolase [Acidobacteriota bacterium]